MLPLTFLPHGLLPLVTIDDSLRGDHVRFKDCFLIRICVFIVDFVELRHEVASCWQSVC